MTQSSIRFGQVQPAALKSKSVKSFSVLLSAIVLASGSIAIVGRSAVAQSMLQEQGSLQPMQQEHIFSGEAGQAVTISLNSGEFDTYIALIDPSGREIAANDDYGRTLNSSIVVTLPVSGQYKVIARSFSGQGGSYTISVNPATSFDQAYSRGVQLFAAGKLGEAAAALSEAIQIEPGQPAPYLDRAEIALAQGNLSAALSDYEQAAVRYEQSGNRQAAEQIRQQIGVLQSQPMP